MFFRRWTQKQLDIFFVAVMVILTAILYGPALKAGFFFDDLPEILTNKMVTEIKPLSAFLTARGLLQRPLTLMTYQFNLWINGTDPQGYHLLNLFLHVAVASLFYAWLRRSRFAYPRVITLLFLTHPLATSAVTYISGRGYLLGTALTFAALLVASGKAMGKAILSCLFAVLAVLAKPFFIVSFVPVMILLFQKGQETKGRWAPALLCLIPASFLIIFFMIRLPAQLADTVLPASLVFFVHPVIAAKILALFLAPLPLGFLYGIELLKGVGPGTLILAHTISLGPLVVVLRRLRTIPFVWLCAVFAGISLTPKNELLAEWRLYPLLPLLALFFVTGMVALLKRVFGSDKYAYAILACLIVAAGLLTQVHNRVWNNELTAWRSFYRANPVSPFHEFNYAQALAEAGRLDDAKNHHLHILRSEASATLIAKSCLSLGLIAIKQNEGRQAMAFFREALRLSPADIRIWRGLGEAERLVGNNQRALELEAVASLIRSWEKR